MNMSAPGRVHGKVGVHNIYVYIYIYVYIHMHIIHTSSYIYIFTCTHIHIYIYIYVYVYSIQRCMYIHTTLVRHPGGSARGQPSLGRAFGHLVAVAHSTSIMIITTIHAANWGFGYCWKFKAQS